MYNVDVEIFNEYNINMILTKEDKFELVEFHMLEVFDVILIFTLEIL